MGEKPFLVSVSVELYKPVYNPGDTIYGTVVIDSECILFEPKLAVKIQGIESTYLRPNNKGVKGYGRLKKEGKKQQQQLKQGQSLKGWSGKGGKQGGSMRISPKTVNVLEGDVVKREFDQIQAGNWEFKFKYVLPKDLPSSIHFVNDQASFAKIEYFVQVSLKIPNASKTLCASQGFRIEEYCSDYKDFSGTTPTISTVEDVLGTPLLPLCINPLSGRKKCGTAKISGNMRKGCFRAGEETPLWFSIENDSNLTMEELDLDLVQETVVLDGDEIQRKINRFYLASLRGVRARDRIKTKEVRIKFPFDLEQSSVISEHVVNQYSIEITIGGQLVSKNIKLRLPVEIMAKR